MTVRFCGQRITHGHHSYVIPTDAYHGVVSEEATCLGWYETTKKPGYPLSELATVTFSRETKENLKKVFEAFQAMGHVLSEEFVNATKNFEKFVQQMDEAMEHKERD